MNNSEDVPSLVYYCINLERRRDRRNAAMEEAAKGGISLEFVDAVDGLDLNLDEVSEYNKELRLKYYEGLSRGDVGCCLSHKKAFEQFLDSDYQFAVVLEDDFVIPNGFRRWVEEFITDTKGWEAVRLQRSRKQEGPTLHSQGGFEIIYPIRVGLTTTACIYTRGGARKAIKVYESFFLPVDYAMKFCHLKGLSILEVNPKMVSQREGVTSDIGGKSQKPPIEKGWWPKFVVAAYSVLGQGMRVLFVPAAMWKFRVKKPK